MKGLRLIIAFVLVVLTTIGDINAGSESHGTVDFYGHNLNIIYDYNFQEFKFRSMDQDEFNSRIQYFRNHNLAQTIQQIKKHSDFYLLDDVGLILLIEKFTEQQMPSQRKNERNFVKYVLLKEMGYDVLLTRASGKINCLGNLSFTPGRYLYIEYNNKIYKDLDFENRVSGGKHFIFMDAKKTYRTITRNVLSLPRINANSLHKNLQFNYGGEEHEIEAISNQSILEFLDDLPMYSIGNEYTILSMSAEMNETLIPYLQKQLIGRSKAEGVQFLLSFVQQTTPYGSDYEKYGEERFYYPEETIMAESADCEDKTFLLAYLAKRLLNVKAVALYFEYDEHLSIGLEIPDYNSYSFTYKSKSYVSCEPTAQTPRLGFSNFNLKRVTKVIEL